MSRLSTETNDMQARAVHVAKLIHKLLDDIAEEAHAEGWDGREMFTGLGVAYGMACVKLGITFDDGMRYMKNLAIPDVKKEYSQIVAPNGRPLAKVT